MQRAEGAGSGYSTWEEDVSALALSSSRRVTCAVLTSVERTAVVCLFDLPVCLLREVWEPDAWFGCEVK